MDSLRRDDIERARTTPPGEKLSQALEMMAAGIRLKRASLRAKSPGASDDELDQLVRAWLEQDA
jgi:hypothetical protein